MTGKNNGIAILTVTAIIIIVLLTLFVFNDTNTPFTSSKGNTVGEAKYAPPSIGTNDITTNPTNEKIDNSEN